MFFEISACQMNFQKEWSTKRILFGCTPWLTLKKLKKWTFLKRGWIKW